MGYGGYKTHDVLGPCQRKLHVVFKTTGKHFRAWYPLDGDDYVSITVSKANDPIREGLFAKMAREFHLSQQNFARFLECPLQEPEYIEILHEFKKTGIVRRPKK